MRIQFTGGEGAKSLAAPEIRFTKFGTYHIGVTIRSVNECNVKKRQFEIIVRDVPRVTFHKLENECKGVELGFTPEKIEYVRNNCDLTYAWNVTPSTGWSIDHADSKYPKITFDASGQYEIEVKVTGQCGGERKYARKMTVLDTHLEAIASPIRPDIKTGRIPSANITYFQYHPVISRLTEQHCRRQRGIGIRSLIFIPVQRLYPPQILQRIPHRCIPELYPQRRTRFLYIRRSNRLQSGIENK